MLRVLISLLFCAAAALPQESDRRCAELLTRGDHGGAAAVIGAVPHAPHRARLQAALLPPVRRAAAMLAVAVAFPADPEADRAILAGAAGMLVALHREAASADLAALAGLEELLAATEADDAEAADGAALAALVTGLWRALAARERAGGDHVVLAEARRLLELCSITRVGRSPARIAPAVAWTAPAPLNEDLLLRACRVPCGPTTWRDLILLRAAEVTVDLPQGPAGRMIPALPPGAWLVELAQRHGPWRTVRTIEVSDLDVLALRADGVVALGAWRGAEAVPTAEILAAEPGDAGSPLGRTDDRGLAVLPIGHGASGLQVRTDAATAFVALPRSHSGSMLQSRWEGHLMVDRPIHRPGETIQGRVVMRRCVWQGEQTDSRVTTVPAPDQPLELRVTDAAGSQQRLAGRTDGHGVFTFSVPVSGKVALGRITLQVVVPGEDAERPEPVAWARPTQVRNFRRPAVQLRTEGPVEVRLGGTPRIEVALHAAWASGGPAAGVPVTVQARAWRNGQWTEERRLFTAADGRAVLPIELGQLDAGWLQLQFGAEAPDGRVERVGHSVRLLPSSTASVEEPSGPTQGWLALSGPEEAVVGRPVEVQLRGPASARVLLVAGRGGAARVQVVSLDAQGRGTASVTPHRDEWPALDLAATTAERTDSLRVPLRLGPVLAPDLELPAEAAPGQQVTCRLRCAPDSVVTVAVVDERIFALARDQTPDPTEALRPGIRWPGWVRATSALARTPAAVLGELLEDGRVPPLDGTGELDRGAATGGPAGGAIGDGDADLRTDFRATAAFVTVRSDGEGRVEVPFQLPDDLTTWRVTVVGIGPDGDGFRVRSSLCTRKPLGAEPLLPRVLREGDAVRVPVVVDRRADAVAPAGEPVRLEAMAEGDALQVDLAAVAVAVAAGATARVEVPVRAAATGAGALSLSARLGAHLDRSRRPVAVLPDAVEWPLTAVGSGRGRVEVPVSAEGRSMQVTVLGGGAAAWQEVERRLEEYPYGCVEQTLSRLLPYFAAARGARVHGAAMPAQGPGFDVRLAAGLHRLRGLQRGPGGPFAWWGGGDVDPGMTALVLHGLAVMRQAGMEPQATGLTFDPARRPFAGVREVVDGVAAAPDEAQRAAIELAAGLLRWDPEVHRDARGALTRLLDDAVALPPGLLVRVGLALQAAGDGEAAARCLAALQGSASPRALSGDGFPGEDPVAVRAQALELLCLARPGDPEIDRRATALLGDVVAGRCSTYVQGVALCALALALPPEARRTATVRVIAGGTERSLELHADNGYSECIAMPAAGRCRVEGPPELLLLVQVTTRRQEPASSHRGWSESFQVTRELGRRAAAAADGFVPLAEERLLAGAAVELRVRVTPRQAVRYAVVECPLPAGFELPDEPPDLERFDDRVAFTFAWLAAGETATRTFTVVPTLAGRMVFPPTVAKAMYVADCEGGSAGGWVDVLPAPVAAADAVAPCFGGTPPVVPAGDAVDGPEDVALRAASAMGESWWEAADLAAEAASQQRFDANLGILWQQAAAAPDTVLTELTDLLEDFREARVGSGTWRFRARLRIGELLEQQTLTVLAMLETGTGGQDRDYRCWRLRRALANWPRQPRREQAAARLLLAASTMGTGVGAEMVTLLDDLEPPARTTELRAALQALLGSGLPALRWRALQLLPDADVAALPPAVLVAAQDGIWSAGLIARLARTPAGRAELRVHLADPQFVRWQEAELLAELPPEMWREVPLQGFCELARTGDAPVVRLLESAGCSEAELIAELLLQGDADVRVTLAEVLRRRGARGLGAAAAAAGDSSLLLLDRALACAPGDHASAEDLLASLGPLTDWSPWSEPVLKFALRAVARAAEPETLARLATEIPEEAWPEAMARLGSAEQVRLLAAVEPSGWLPTLPTPGDGAVVEALWHYGLRCGELPAAVDALCRTELGAAFVRDRLTDLTGEDQEAARIALADALGLDRDTLGIPADAPWRPVLCSVRRFGLVRSWSEDEARLLDRLLRLRGLAFER